MIRRGAIPAPVTRLLLRPTLLKLLAVLALIEGVFLAETFEGLMNAVLDHGGSFKGLAWLLALNAPQVAALALALGLLIALFFALSDARARGELIILAAAGVGWQRVVGFALAVGLAGGVAAWAIAGQLVPRAHQAERLAIAALQADHIRAQILGTAPRRALQQIGPLTFALTAAADGAQGQNRQDTLFVFEEAANGWRAGLSRDWAIEGPDKNGQHALVLRALTGLSGSMTDQGPRADAIRTRTATLSFAMDRIAPPADPARLAGEMPVSFASGEGRAALLARALLVPFAALAGLVALVSARGVARHASLPLAVLAVMATDVAGRAILPALPLPFAVLALLCAVLYLVPPLVILARSAERLMIPERGAQ